MANGTTRAQQNIPPGPSETTSWVILLGAREKQVIAFNIYIYIYIYIYNTHAHTHTHTLILSEVTGLLLAISRLLIELAVNYNLQVYKSSVSFRFEPGYNNVYNRRGSILNSPRNPSSVWRLVYIYIYIYIYTG